MKFRPKSLVLLSFILVCVGISIPLQVAMIYEHTWSEWTSVWDKLTYLNIAVMTLCFVNAFFLFQGSRHAIPTTAVLIPVTLINNYWAGLVATDYSIEMTMIGSVVFVLAHGLMLVPNGRAVLQNPSNRWWRTAHRRKVEIPMMVSPWLH